MQAKDWSRVNQPSNKQSIMEDNNINIERLIEQVAVLTVQVAELQLEIKR